MSLAAILWILGGWFVLSTVAGLMIAKMVSQHASADLLDGVDAPAQASHPVEQVTRRSKVA